MPTESVVHVARVAGPADASGDATAVDGARTAFPAYVWPWTSAETDEPGRDSVVIGLTIGLPAGTVVSPRDRMEARGGLYEVDGEPADYRSPWTSRGLVVVNIKRVRG